MFNQKQTLTEPIFITLLLAVAAVVFPLPLYGVALALFGLPHVLSEAGWIWKSYGNKIPKLWWQLVLAILLLQAGSRFMGWVGIFSTTDVATLDLLTLALALCSVVIARSALKTPLWLCSLAISIAVLLFTINEHPRLQMITLALLSIAHNFTPLLLTPKSYTWGKNQALRPLLRMMFFLPIALLLLPMSSWTLSTSLTGFPMPSEAKMLGLAEPLSVLPAFVLAQCLHYYAVIRLLPNASDSIQEPTQNQALFKKYWIVALVLCIALSLYFAFSYSNARSLYAVVAGIHAWLEWPLLMLLANPQSFKMRPDD